VLGIGGEQMLHALGFAIDTFHLNEGHAALLAAARLRRYALPRDRLTGGNSSYDIAPGHNSARYA
jgi:starch phosphorylase